MRVSAGARGQTVFLVFLAGVEAAWSNRAMARRLQIQYPDAIYHVIARGNARQEIVTDDADRRRLHARLLNRVSS